MATPTAYPPPYITLPLGDGEYVFKLNLPQIAELQTKCGIGIGGLYARVLAGRYLLQNGENVGMPTEAEWRAEDLLDTIRLALIGGKGGTVDGSTVAVNAARAKELVELYCFPAQPLAQSWSLAAAILTALIEGYTPAAEADKKKAEEPAETDTST